MIAVYLALYGAAVLLMTLGLLIPAILVAVVAHGVHRLPSLVRVRPIRDIHG